MALSYFDKVAGFYRTMGHRRNGGHTCRRLVWPASRFLISLRSAVVFSSTSTTARMATELWTSDGTAAGTVMVKDIDLGCDSFVPGPDERQRHALLQRQTTVRMATNCGSRMGPPPER